MQEALIGRDETVTEWTFKYRCVASTLEGLYRVAELNELAAPTNRRRRGEGTPKEPVSDTALSVIGEPSGGASMNWGR